MEERGLVYCEEGHCILVPTVCRNVSRIQRLARPTAIAPAAATNLASSAREMEADPQALLEMDPPSAGVMGGGSPSSFAAQAGGGAGLDGGSLGTPGSTTPGAQPNFAGGNAGPGIGLGVPSLPPGRVTDGGLIDPTLPIAPPVPEPGSWAMLLAGLAAVFFVARRRRR